MKIILAGGTGQVGRILSRAFERDGHEVVVLSRRAAQDGTRTVLWDGRTVGPWMMELEGADVVVNLAGRSVNCRYNRKKRREIMESRVDSVRAIGEAIALTSRAPRVWLQASTATIYAHRYDAPNDERTGRLGGTEPHVPDTWRFSIDVARAWEEAALAELPLPHTRQVLMRSAIIMSPDAGGAFRHFLGFARLGLGGCHGNGRQYVSWIHEEDFVRAIYFLIERPDLEGAVNLAAPGPLPEKEFMADVRAACGQRLFISIPAWLAEIGAVFLRTETELILKSRYVVPTKLLEAGFAFRYPAWREAARELCARNLPPTSARGS